MNSFEDFLHPDFGVNKVTVPEYCEVSRAILEYELPEEIGVCKTLSQNHPTQGKIF